MGRLYTLTARQTLILDRDFFQLEAATGKPIYIHSVEFGQTSDMGDINSEGLIVVMRNRITLGVIPATTVFAVDKNDTAFSGNAGAVRSKINTGAVDIYALPWNTAIPFTKIWTPKLRPYIIPGDSFTVNLTFEPDDQLSVAGTLEFEEMG